MDVTQAIISRALLDVCETFKLNVLPKPFQEQFFLNAAKGIGGFLEV